MSINTAKTSKKRCLLLSEHLDGGNSALVIGFLVETCFEASKHFLLRHFGASTMALTEARLLKHDLPVDGEHSLLTHMYSYVKFSEASVLRVCAL